MEIDFASHVGRAGAADVVLPRAVTSASHSGARTANL